MNANVDEDVAGMQHSECDKYSYRLDDNCRGTQVPRTDE